MEYKTVLFRPKFPFHKRDVQILLDTIIQIGASVLAEPSKVPFSDVTDKKFLEVALSAGALLITGNGKHYPEHACVLSPAKFLERFSV
jgi:predicted nucleic acid-binding protein